MTKRLITLSTLVALAAVAAFAQPPGQGRRGGQSWDRPGPGGGPKAERLVRALDLSEEQTAILEELTAGLRESTKPIHEAQRGAHEELKALLEDGSEDAAAIGNLVLEIHDLRAQAQTARQQFEAEFSAILDAEQLERWEIMKEMSPRHRGPRGDGHGGPLGE